MAFRPSLFGQLPRRAGFSKVLDALVTVFANILVTQQSQFEEPSARSLLLYVSGLKKLRNSIENPASRYDSDTLAAAYILSECNTWMAQNRYLNVGHGEGLAYLIGLVLRQKPNDSFFSIIHASLLLGIW